MDEEELPPPFYDSIEPYLNRRLIMANDFFQRMCKEAQDEIASGEKGWREADTNTLLLACFGMLTNHLTHKLARPLWFFSSTFAAGVITFIVKSILG